MRWGVSAMADTADTHLADTFMFANGSNILSRNIG